MGTFQYTYTTRIKGRSIVRIKRRKAVFLPTHLLFCLLFLTSLRGQGQYCSNISDKGCYFPIIFADATELVDDEKKSQSSMIVLTATDPAAINGTSAKLRGGNLARGTSPTQKTGASFSEILKKAGKNGMGGGVPGAIAGVCQVLSLMWLRTIMNYQCRYGASFSQTVRILYNEGGISRFYRGLRFALVQAPLARFVSTAANDGVESLLANLKWSANWGPGKVTVIASIVVGMWRMLLMPIDTCKTVLQVDSVTGFRSLMRKVKAGQIQVLYQGKWRSRDIDSYYFSCIHV